MIADVFILLLYNSKQDLTKENKVKLFCVKVIPYYEAISVSILFYEKEIECILRHKLYTCKEISKK